MAHERTKLMISLAKKANEDKRSEETDLNPKLDFLETTGIATNDNNSSTRCSDYMLQELQPVIFASSNEPEQRGFLKLPLPCTIKNDKVLNWLDNHNLDGSLIIGEEQPTLPTKESEVFFHSEVKTLASVNPYEIDDVYEPINHHIEETERSNDMSSSSSSSSSKNIPLIELRIRLKNLRENNEENLNPGSSLKKRKYYDTDLKTRKILKAKQIANDHPVLPGCSQRCKKMCVHILEETRKNINNEFWKLSKTEQKSFILNTCKRLEIKRRTSTNMSRKQNTFKYYFNNNKGETVEVCKIFFLTTLGYKKNNDRVVHDTLSKTPKGQLTPLRHGSIGKSSQGKIDDTELNAHIESFNPEISHYRREHAPKTRYLGSDITITLMYKDFQKKFSNTKVSYETYRRRIKAKRISFTKLGHEECDACENFKLHGHDETNFQDMCEKCKLWKNHLNRAKESRHLYKEQAKTLFPDDTVCVSTDLQKIVMLPRLDMFKKVIFQKRLIAYNETFVPLGKISKNNKPLAVVWHEAISKRSKEDLISTFYAFLKLHRDALSIIIWMDNCASQNKNWTMLTFLVRMINSNEISANTITFNYFEPGHTFMSADSFHHQVELSMKRKQKIYDFDDFAEAVGSACKGNVDVKKMNYGDFYNWQNSTSLTKLNKTTENRPYLSDMVQIVAERSAFTLKYRRSFDGPLQLLDFLMYKAMKKRQLLKPVFCLQRPRGFSQEKKQNLLKQLGDLFPENRKTFWESLPTLEENEEESE